MEFNNLIGLPVNAANNLLQDKNMTIRVVKINGNACICTRDYKTNRLNVEVNDDVITEIKYIG